MPATNAVGEQGWKELNDEGDGGCLVFLIPMLMPTLALIAIGLIKFA